MMLKCGVELINLALIVKKLSKFYLNQKICIITLRNYSLGGVPIERVGSLCNEEAFKFLGHWVDETLNWNIHTQKTVAKLNSTNYVLAKIKKY